MENVPSQRRGQIFSVSAIICATVLLTPFSQELRAERYEAVAAPDSQEGQLLDLIELQSDSAKKLTLIEQFAQRFPKHKAVSWAYQRLQEAAFEASQWERVLLFGEKLSVLNPDDMDVAQMNLKAAEAKGDKTTVKLWRDYATLVAQRILLAPPPKDPDLLEEWKKRIAIASQYSAQDEYSLYKKALNSSEPREQIKLLEELLRRNPESTYLPQALIIYLNAYRAIGDHRNALLTAEKILRTDRNNEDALLVAAQSHLQSGSAQEKVISYSTRIIELMNTKQKPAAVRQEDWDRKRTVYVGTAYWMTGNTYINQNRYGAADTALRAALPLLRQSEQSTASLLFYLGWANYKLENYSEAVRFYKQCGAVPGQFQDQALKNLAVLRAEQGIQDED